MGTVLLLGGLVGGGVEGKTKLWEGVLQASDIGNGISDMIDDGTDRVGRSREKENADEQEGGKDKITSDMPQGHYRTALANNKTPKKDKRQCAKVQRSTILDMNGSRMWREVVQGRVKPSRVTRNVPGKRRCSLAGQPGAGVSLE